MDQLQPSRGRSPSLNINQAHSPSPSPAPSFITDNNALGLGVTIDPSSTQQFAPQPDYSAAYTNVTGTTFLATTPALVAQDLSYDPNQSFADQLKTDSVDNSFNHDFLGTPEQSFTGGDFTIFPPPSADQPLPSLFNQQQQHQQPQDQIQDISMTTSQPSLSPTPPHLLPGSAQHSPSFNAHQFIPQQPITGHVRHASLGTHLLPGQDWSGIHFQGHRRTASEFSEASSIGGHSPSIGGQDAFNDSADQISSSPMLHADETGDVYQELNGINNFSISNPHRSPSHSPSVSPRLLPQAPVVDMASGAPSYILQSQNDYQSYLMGPGPSAPEAFPQLPSTEMPQQMPQMTAPTIEIQYAPPNTTNRGLFEGKAVMDTDALKPPEQRGRPRRRAITDPYNRDGLTPGRLSPAMGGLSPNISPDGSPRLDVSSRSLSPLERSGSAVAGNRRRVSTSAVPNNDMALRLADPDFAAALSADGTANNGANGAGAKRTQKHPATFQCTICPKRFTRAYNLRSHLRTHTDERPFVCSFCKKAFARQHDRKRHEGLHSGEKKFVCKGELKVGGEWGCGRRFARADALGRHFRSEAGRICIKPLLDEELLERHRAWQEQNMAAQQAAVQQNMMMVQQPPQVDPNAAAGAGYSVDAAGNYGLPAALLAQYPALAQVNWSNVDMSGAGSGMEDEISGRSSFEASDLDDGDDGGYVSGPGTGFGEGGMGENFGELGYASDYGGR